MKFPPQERVQCLVHNKYTVNTQRGQLAVEGPGFLTVEVWWEEGQAPAINAWENKSSIRVHRTSVSL